MEYKEEIEEAIELNYSFEDLAADLTEREDNFNNADTTSKQKVREYHEIISEIETTVDLLKQDSDHCSYCGARNKEDCFITETQRHPYGETGADETIVIGYECPFCGEQENY